MEEDVRLSGKDRYERGKLIEKIDANEELTIEDLNNIKERIGKVCTPVVVYSAWNLLEDIIKQGDDDG
jgi:phosphotransferase system IIA component